MTKINKKFERSKLDNLGVVASKDCEVNYI